jgi:hypothetical protein
VLAFNSEAMLVVITSFLRALQVVFGAAGLFPDISSAASSVW